MDNEDGYDEDGYDEMVNDPANHIARRVMSSPVMDAVRDTLVQLGATEEEIDIAMGGMEEGIYESAKDGLRGAWERATQQQG